MEKKDLLENVDAIKKDIEDGRITDLVIAGTGEKEDMENNPIVICSSITKALGMVELLKMEVTKSAQNQSKKNEFKQLLSMFADSDPEDDEGDE